MRQLMCLQTIRLCESRVTNITLVRFFPGVYSQMPFQFERIRTGVSAMGTLVGPFARMTSYVPFQFRQFHTGIIALVTFVGFFMGVPIANVSHQFTGSGESCLTESVTEFEKIK